jgi:mRNA-degrading endonuclease YafQ of YafQ-DinJ toxin-antitoxin module
MAEAREYFSHVNGVPGQFDRSFLEWLTSHLLAYEAEFGVKAVSSVIKTLSAHLSDLGISNADHKLKGCYYANRAFENFRLGNFHEAQTSAFRAFLNYPANLGNKGLLSVMLHSIPLLNSEWGISGE